ncbi:MAG: VOC family protein [Cyanobacteria bacterium LVE1205-1]|jgi:extradiol dioxygenase family protein
MVDVDQLTAGASLQMQPQGSSAVIFHLAFPVKDLEETKSFYVNGLGCGLGRETKTALILNLYGHQLVAHVTDELTTKQKGIYPRHFGLIFLVETHWHALLVKASERQLLFYQGAKQRFIGSPLEHRTFFLQDPSGNLMEFKFYRYPEAIFGDRTLHCIGDG